MLEKAPDEAFHPDVLGKTGHLGPQAADAAHHEIDGDARLARLVERGDDLRIDERIHLGPDRCRAAGLGVRDLLLDVRDDPFADAVGTCGHVLQRRRLSIAGYEIENAGDVAANRGSAVKNDRSV